MKFNNQNVLLLFKGASIAKIMHIISIDGDVISGYTLEYIHHDELTEEGLKGLRCLHETVKGNPDKSFFTNVNSNEVFDMVTLST